MGKRWQISGCVLAALMCIAVPRTAEAQTAPADVSQARQLFVEASELRDHGDVRGALDKFRAAHALAANPITTFELARTYEALGMLEEARDAYASIARLALQPDETERAAAARRDGAKAAEALKVRIPPPAVQAAAAAQVAPAVQGASALQAAPAVQAPSPAETCKGAAAPPQLALASLVDTSRQAPEGSGNHFGPIAYAGFGVGATGFVVGTILAGATMSKASSISCTSASCQQSSEDAAHSARELGIAATVSYVIAGTGVAVGLADLLLYRRPTTPPTEGLTVHAWVGAGAGGLLGSF